MENLRTYGDAPFDIAVLHGGPGAAGEMAPVARELSKDWGVLEPLQTAETLEGQVAELQAVLKEHAHGPVSLVGFSWGAWLGVILASRFPGLVKKLILVGCGPFYEADAQGIHERRMGRLTPEERAEVNRLMPSLNDPSEVVRDEVFGRFGALFSKADAFDPLDNTMDEVMCSARIFKGVWPGADALRRRGDLLAMASTISCPVVAIHGDTDPHPAKGVQGPLSECLDDFRFILLPRCGHKPWGERQARGRFFEVLRGELG
ncbi:alpha/beta fold hydrolase [Desulfoluna limicola]|nr:alpha/beta hydrolase [Desulfoluna limicola]